MNKKFSMLMVLLLIATLALTACGGKATEAPPATDVQSEPATEVATQPPAAETPILAVSLPSLDNPLMLGFQDAYKGAFGADFDVQIASADGNPNTQATQVENFTAMGVKFMFVMPIESSSLVPNLIAARQAGVIVLVAGGDPGDPEAYDSVMMMNQYLSGWFAAYNAKQWIDQVYADTAAGSLETVIFESSLNTDAVARSNGLKMISEPYMKNVDGEYTDADGNVVAEAGRVANPAYAPQVNVVQVVQAEMFQAGQTAMQNAFTTNPNVKLVIAYAGDGGMGASQAIIDEFAKGPGVSLVDDLNNYAVFSVGMIGPEGQAVLDSATNKTVFRGTIRFGGDLVGRTMQISGAMMGGDITKVIYDPLEIIFLVDGALTGIAIEDTEVFRVPTGASYPVVLMGPP